jgi:thiol-disulfide isomerase/thioredoxin
MNRILSSSALALTLCLAGCGGESPAEPAAVVASTEKVEPAFVEGLPRDQWLSCKRPSAERRGRGSSRRSDGLTATLAWQPVPAFSAELVGGGAVSQEIFRGKWTIVDVWGIWCGDCRRDGPLVKTLAQLAEVDPDIDFLSLHTPPNRKRAAEAYGAFGSVEAYFESQGGGHDLVDRTPVCVRR